MSSSLVWKSLQSFDQESSKAKKGSTGGAVSGNKIASKEATLLTRRHGAKKQLKKLRREQKLARASLLGDKSLLLPSLKRAQKSSVQITEEEQILENLRLLQEVSKPVIDAKKAERILNRATKNEIKLVQVKEDTSTVFTEADFAKFAKNYVPD